MVGYTRCTTRRTSSSSAAASPACARPSTLARSGRVLVLTKAEPDESNTGYAQGGIAAAVGPTTIAGPARRRHAWPPATACASATRCACWSRTARATSRELADWGARFDRDADGRARARARGRAQRAPRAARARRDRPRDWPGAVAARRALPPACGSSITRAPSRWSSSDGRCVGVALRRATARLAEVRAGATLLATGGAGQVFRETTNPPVATGDGVALAWHAGARGGRPRVRAVPSDGAGRAGHAAVPALRGAARRGRAAAQRARRALHDRYEPPAIWRRATGRRAAIVREDDADRAAGVPCRCAHLDAEWVHARFPTIAATCRERRPRPRARPDAGRRRPRTT